MYQVSETDSQRLSIINKVVDFKDRAFAPLFVEALSGLYESRIEKGTPLEIRDRIDLAKLLVREIGNQRITEGEPLVKAVYLDVKEPFLKSEAAISLAKFGNQEMVPKLNRDLLDINLTPDPASSRLQEVLAYGLISAFGLYKIPETYEAVFIASLSWYPRSSGIKQLAQSVLPLLSDDPKDFLANIIRGDRSYEYKLAALDAEKNSKAPKESKIFVAQTALSAGLEKHETDIMSKQGASNLRFNAITLLFDLQDASPESVPLLAKAIDYKYSADEQILAYRALGNNTSEESVKYLNSMLNFYNLRQQSALNTSADRVLIRQILASITKLANPLSKDVLTQAEVSNHDGQVVREIKLALQAING